MDSRALHSISYGLYVVSSRAGEKFNGQIANTVFQVISEPPAVVVCLNKENLTHQYIQESRKFSVSVLSRETPMKFIGRFGFQSGRKLDKFAGVDFKVGSTGSPIALENSLSYLELEVMKEVDAATHTLFIGRVVQAEVIAEGEPMTYAYYHQVKHGREPKTAPTYAPEEPKNEAVKEEEKMEKYVCTVCGYVYDQVKGDPDGGIAAGTAFADIPDDWVCPVCGVGKDQFELQE